MSLPQIMREVREALANIPRDVSHVVGQPPALNEVLTPPSHALALDPEAPIVVGARGAGKSFWASILADDTVREAVASYYPRLRLGKLSVRPGFVDQAISTAVSRDSLDELATSERATRKVWQIVAIRAGEDVLRIPTFRTLTEGLNRYPNSEDREIRLREIDTHLSMAGGRVLVLFDALDRLAGDWNDLRLRTTTLLETLLGLRAYRSIKFKLFMRPEQLSSVPVGFTDLSKLKAGAFDLRWSTHDLYGLAFNWLANESNSAVPFQELLARLRLPSPTREDEKIGLPSLLLRDEEVQERVFRSIAGPYMGTDKRRGKTYTWLPKHLSDTKGRVMPRSFLTALGSAARDGRQPRSDFALSIEGIKHGVSSASVLRIEQLKDEYGWIELALGPLAGQEVPCHADFIFERWETADTLDAIAEDARSKGYLPPASSSNPSDYPTEQLLSALMDIGVVEVRSDERINIPDLFRIAALMLRRGGPRPLASA